MQQVCEQGQSRRGGSVWLVLAVVGALALFHPNRAAAQCCACFLCAADNFCVDDVAGQVACATLCNNAGCPNFAFEDGDICMGGCGGQPDFPTATPTGTAAATATDTPTHTPEPTATDTVAATPSATDTHTVGATPTDTPTLPAGTATATVTSTPTSNPLDTATATATSTPTSNPLDTATVTPTLTPTETSPNVVHVDVGTAVGQPGGVVGFANTIDAQRPVMGLQVCISYDAQTPIRAVANAPDCTAGDSVSGLFSFQPAGCTPGTTCTGVCADLSGAPDFPVSGTIFTCRVAIAPNAAVGTYPLGCTIDAQGVGGEPVVASCTDGEVIVQTNVPGDCNGDGIVTISELITGVNIALGNLPVTACPAFDTDHNGQVSVAELIAAVNVALTQP